MAKTATKTTKPEASAEVTDSRRFIGENSTFSITLPWKEIEAAQSQALQRYQQSSKLEGFRKGKAPTKLIAQNLGESGLREMVLEQILPNAYRTALQENKLLPLTDPEVQLDNVKPNEDWKVTFFVAVAPDIKVENYEKIVKELKKTHPAWKEEKPAKKSEKDAEATEESPVATAEQKRGEQVNAVIEALLEKIEVIIPELLLRSETRRRLEDLGKQLDAMKLTLEDYLTRTNRTTEQVQQEIAAQALLSLQVELLLASIIKFSKLTVEHELVHKALPTDRKYTQAEHDYAESMLLKQRAVDHLLTL